MEDIRKILGWGVQILQKRDYILLSAFLYEYKLVVQD